MARRAPTSDARWRALEEWSSIGGLARSAEDEDTVRRTLNERFGFDDDEAEAVLDLRVRDLVHLGQEWESAADAWTTAGDTDEEQAWRSRIAGLSQRRIAPEEVAVWRRCAVDGVRNGWLTVARLADRPAELRFTGPATGAGSIAVVVEHDGGDPVRVHTTSDPAGLIVDDEHLAVMIGVLGGEDIDEIGRSWRTIVEIGTITVPFDGRAHEARALAMLDGWAFGFAVDDTTVIECAGVGAVPELELVHCTDLETLEPRDDPTSP
ncbi:MAG: hypothetical protein S0880_27995 [Actinomycetota bacterium]|nr:hypothetical protein [Actinomycetota bacterium]